MQDLKPAAEDFRIFWDNAYGIHHLYEDKQDYLIEILDGVQESRTIRTWFTNSALLPRSASQVPVLQLLLHPTNNLRRYQGSDEAIQTIGHDKLNQLRHARFFKDIHGMVEHMKKHADIFRPKFDSRIKRSLESELRRTWDR